MITLVQVIPDLQLLLRQLFMQ